MLLPRSNALRCDSTVTIRDTRLGALWVESLLSPLSHECLLPQYDKARPTTGWYRRILRSESWPARCLLCRPTMPPPPPPPPDPVPSCARPSHVLRPHHVFLLYIFMHGFFDSDEDESPFPKKFTLTLHRLMIREVAEVHNSLCGLLPF